MHLTDNLLTGKTTLNRELKGSSLISDFLHY